MHFAGELLTCTASDLFSGHGYSGNDCFSGTKPLDDAILFTNSRITALVELFFLESFKMDLSKAEILKLTKIPKTFFSNKAKKSHIDNSFLVCTHLA